MTVKDLIKELKKQPKDAVVKIKVDNWSIEKNETIDSSYEDIEYITTTKYLSNEDPTQCDLRVMISMED